MRKGKKMNFYIRHVEHQLLLIVVAGRIYTSYVVVKKRARGVKEIIKSKKVILCKIDIKKNILYKLLLNSLISA